MFLNNKKTAVVLSLLAVFLLLIDRYLKQLALTYVGGYSLIGDILQFSFAKNYFIAFSLPLGGKFLMGLIIIIILGLVAYCYKLAKNKEWIQVVLLTNIIFGALSNLFDRLQLGFVIDYIDLKYFTVFNVADMMIVGGVTVLLLISYRK